MNSSNLVKFIGVTTLLLSLSAKCGSRQTNPLTSIKSTFETLPMGPGGRMFDHRLIVESPKELQFDSLGIKGDDIPISAIEKSQVDGGFQYLLSFQIASTSEEMPEVEGIPKSTDNWAPGEPIQLWYRIKDKAFKLNFKPEAIPNQGPDYR